MKPFNAIPNAADANQTDRPLMQKDRYEVSEPLLQYLHQYRRVYLLPLRYPQLLHYRYTDAIRDAQGKHTHWEKVTYTEALWQELKPQLLETARLLFQQPSLNRLLALDFCEYANSMPFRVRVADVAGQEMIYYIKSSDASRVFGLELEHLLSGNSIHYLYQQHTLIEAHIAGIPGDDFLPQLSAFTATEKQELAKAFVAFNESCFVRLLGDMRSYNFVQYQAPGAAYHFRAIDFDNQCSEGSLHFYLPQFYKENYSYVQLVKHVWNEAQIEHCRAVQRQTMLANALQQKQRLLHFLQIIASETLADTYKVIQLQQQLNAYHHTAAFASCHTMGQLLQQQLNVMLGL
jgi:hypothetical protein